MTGCERKAAVSVQSIPPPNKPKTRPNQKHPPPPLRRPTATDAHKVCEGKGVPDHRILVDEGAVLFVGVGLVRFGLVSLDWVVWLVWGGGGVGKGWRSFTQSSTAATKHLKARRLLPSRRPLITPTLPKPPSTPSKTNTLPPQK